MPQQNFNDNSIEPLLYQRKNKKKKRKITNERTEKENNREKRIERKCTIFDGLGSNSMVEHVVRRDRFFNKCFPHKSKKNIVRFKFLQ